MKKLWFAFFVIGVLLVSDSARADNRYVPPFVMRLTNSYYVRITNNEASTKRVRCIALITSGTGVGTVAITDLNISGSGTGDCRPSAGIEWNLQAVVHQGSITVGSFDGTNLINMDTSPATPTTEGVYQVDFSNQAEPATPGTGITAVYTDSTSKILCGKADTGTVTCLSGIPSQHTYRTCSIVVLGTGTAGVLQTTDADYDDQDCFVPKPSTVVEITVRADAGTPDIKPGRDRLGTQVNLISGAGTLATAASGAQACSNAGGITGLDGATTCAATLQNTGLNAGDWLGLVNGVTVSTAHRISVAITYTVN